VEINIILAKMEPGIGIGGPLDILKLLIGSAVAVELRDTSVITGLLKGFDEHVNVILTKAQTDQRSHDVLFIRGDLVCMVREG